MERKFLNKVFIIEDDKIFGSILKKSLENMGDGYDVQVFQSGTDFFNAIHENPDIVSIDFNLPDMNGLEILKRIKSYNEEIGTIILSGQEKVEVVVEAYSNGANHYIIKNENALVELSNSVQNLSSNVNLRKEVEVLREQIIDRNKYSSVVGESPGVLKVLRMIQKVEKSKILVLITGESGTGKEVIANTIHYNSPRKRKPFVAVNVAAIPADLIESELFGHEKGAFTGATGRRIGKFEEANGGTIFLDEIGEMELGLQTKLLRVLQENAITRVGSNKEIHLDVRVLAATNKNLHERVKKGLFREDLYYRLQGFLIHLPPLRERGNDVVLLSNHFLRHFCKSSRIPEKTITKEALAELVKHNWPGNVRELKSVIERAALISETEVITPEDLIFSQSIY
ncbi:sigma-54 dependent transcriptional regulator [Pontibacter sp. G13]|uniref:sigma-54-dependent transcriptional regulator n=1 Tax=Pontibacter sp. G13 TaxID=3074898 RepID=UPI002889C75A|nr:sigma-54 dependent transcriptional regulator [Pontibacter sp. G13]WNJ21232.1 sigma-54 dependent transcriptional regulator [Pontibacter sp. G13]